MHYIVQSPDDNLIQLQWYICCCCYSFLNALASCPHIQTANKEAEVTNSSIKKLLVRNYISAIPRSLQTLW